MEFKQPCCIESIADTWDHQTISVGLNQWIFAAKSVCVPIAGSMACHQMHHESIRCLDWMPWCCIIWQVQLL